MVSGYFGGRSLASMALAWAALGWGPEQWQRPEGGVGETPRPAHLQATPRADGSRGLEELHL